MREEDERRLSVAQRVRDVIQAGTTPILMPARTVLLVAIGSSVLLARALQSGLSRAADEGERQLELFNGSIGRTATSLLPWGRAARPAARQRLRTAK